MTWRIDHSVPLNVYDGDRPVCQCHTAEDAARIVEAVNAAEAAASDICRGCNGTGNRVQQYVGNTPVLKPCETCNGTGRAPEPTRAGCSVSPYSSRACEHGTKGCDVRHAPEPLPVDTPEAIAQWVSEHLHYVAVTCGEARGCIADRIRALVVGELRRLATVYEGRNAASLPDVQFTYECVAKDLQDRIRALESGGEK